VLRGINKATWTYARRLLQCLAVASRPLRLEELTEVLAFDFDDALEGIPTLNADWRREDQEQAVLSTCSSLVAVVHDGTSRVVQFSHFSVKEFLMSDRLATIEDISFHHILPEPAHTILAQACVGVLLRLDDSDRETSMQRFPLAEYAARHWLDHALFENISLRLRDGIEYLFDMDKPYFSRWIRIYDMHDPTEVLFGARRWERLRAAAPVFYAALCGLRDMVEKVTGGGNHVQSLLEPGAEANALVKTGWTPLHIASRYGQLEIGRWLLEHGADVNARKVDQWSPLHLAAANGHFELARALLGHNADVDAKNDKGQTPLHRASETGHVSIARFLLDHDAAPNARSRDQSTPLHLASSAGKLEVARLLLGHGADVDATDNQGRTACDIALEAGHAEITQLLLKDSEPEGAESRKLGYEVSP